VLKKGSLYDRGIRNYFLIAAGRKDCAVYWWVHIRPPVVIRLILRKIAGVNLTAENQQWGGWEKGERNKGLTLLQRVNHRSDDSRLDQHPLELI